MEPAQLAIQSMQSGSCSAPMTMVPPCCSAGAVVALADEVEVGAADEEDEPPEELEEQAESARLAAAPPASSTMARRLRPSERVAVMGVLPLGRQAAMHEFSDRRAARETMQARLTNS